MFGAVAGSEVGVEFAVGVVSGAEVAWLAGWPEEVSRLEESEVLQVRMLVGEQGAGRAER